MRIWIALLPLLMTPFPASAQEPPIAADTPAAAATPSAEPTAAPAETPVPVPALVVCAVEGGREGAPIPGATVILVGPDGRATAQTAGSDGCARFETVAAATWKVTVAAPGARPSDFSVVVPVAGGVRKVVALQIASANEEITIDAKREQVGETRRVIDPETARLMPGTQGDALKAVQNLPGTARAPFGAGALLVRGAAPEDTRVFLDGQEIPQLYHFGGLTSVVATEVLSSIDFLPGGFGVRYGRAIGGVVDVETRGAHDEKVSGLIDANVYNAEGEAEGPILGGSKGRLIAAVRRSYIDAILPAVLPSDTLSFTVAPRYYDYQVRYDAPSRPTGTQLHLLAYGSDDEFIFVLKKPQGDAADIRGKFLFRTLFHRFQAPIVKPLASGWVLTATPGIGFQAITIEVGTLASLKADRSDFTARVEARGPVSENVKMLVGLDTDALENRYSIRFPDSGGGDNSGGDGIDTERTLVAAQKYPTVELAGFAEAQIAFAHGLTVVPGIRIDSYFPTRSVSADPRVAIRFEPEKRWFAKAYAGVYHQPPQFHEWDSLFGNPRLKPPVAFQIGAGGGHDYGTSTHVEAEVFYKWLQDLVTQAPGDASDPTSRSHFTNEQIGRAYGMELLVKRELSERLYGFIAYTLSRSERADPYTPDGWHAFDFDQTHIATLLAGYKLPRGWEAGLRFRYTTGNPDSGVAGAIYDADRDTFVPIPGATNRERVPDFHQLDVRFDKKWTFHHWNLDAYLDVQNVYVRQNPEGVRYNFDYSQKFYVTGLPLLPSIGLRGEF